MGRFEIEKYRFVDYRFFIVSHEELAKIQMARNKMTNWAENKGGVDNVLVEHVIDFENSWNKLINNL